MPDARTKLSKGVDGVCFTSPYSLSRVTGVGRFAETLIQELRSRRIRSIAIYPAPARAPLAEGDRPVTLRGRMLRDVELALRTALIVLRTRIQFAILHAQQAHPQSVAALLVARILGRRSVLTLHLVSQTERPAKRWLQALVDRLSVALPDAVVAVSPYIAENVGRSDLVVIENGVDLEAFRPSDEARQRIREHLGFQDELVFVFSGRWSRHKGTDLLLRATESPGLRDRKYRILLLGDRALDEPELLRGFGNSKNHDRLTLAGRVDDVAAYLAAGDVFVLPSRLEGMPLSLLEAMATGLPVLVSDIPVHRMLVERSGCGWTFRSGDADDLARVMAEVLDGGIPVGWPQRARAAAVQYHSLKQLESNYMDLYGRVLGTA